MERHIYAVGRIIDRKWLRSSGDISAESNGRRCINVGQCNIRLISTAELLRRDEAEKSPINLEPSDLRHEAYVCSSTTYQIGKVVLGKYSDVDINMYIGSMTVGRN